MWTSYLSLQRQYRGRRIWSLACAAILCLAFLFWSLNGGLTRGHEATVRELETGGRSVELISNPSHSILAPAASITRAAPDPQPHTPNQVPITSREHAEALVIAASRSGSFNMMWEVRGKRELDRFLAPWEVSDISTRESNRRINHAVRNMGRPVATASTKALLDVFEGVLNGSSQASVQTVRQLQGAHFDPEHMTRLRQMYESSGPVARRMIVEVAREAAGADMASFLVDIAAKSQSVEDSKAALAALQRRIPSDATLQALQAMFHTRQDSGLRRSILGAIGANPSEEAFRFVLERLEDPLPEMRAAAVANIGMTDATQTHVISMAQSDPDARVRVASIDRLAMGGSTEFLQMYFHSAEYDPSPVVRQASVRALSGAQLEGIQEMDHMIDSLRLLDARNTEAMAGEELKRALSEWESRRAIHQRKQRVED